MDSKFLMPLYSPKKNCESIENLKFIAADLRPQVSEIQYYNCKGGVLEPNVQSQLNTTDFASVSDLIKQFISDNNIAQVDKISIAVPGPVINEKCVTSSLPWELDAEKIKNELGVKKVHLLNDLEAVAYSLAEFEKTHLDILHTSENKVRGNVAILAPGNGLGEAGLFWDGQSLRPFATEGGHTEFSPRNDFEVEFYQFMNKIYDIVSWETVLAKGGLYNIYRFLRDYGRHHEEDWLKEKLKNQDFLSVVAEVGAERKSRLINLTLEMYGEFLAREANNLVLKLKATGGLIITGAIPAKIFNLLDKDKFYKDFKLSDKMENLLKDIPLYVLRNDKAILHGVAFYGAFFE